MRALVLADEQDPRLREISDQYMVGDRLLVAPIVQKGQTKRLVYLPAGQWIDFWTGNRYQGQQDIVVTAELDQLPLFVRQDSLLPWADDREYVAEAPETHLTFRLFGESGQYDHYQDNGQDLAYRQGEYNRYQIEVTAEQAQVSLRHHGYRPVYSTITVETTAGSQQFAYDAATEQYVLIPAP